MSDFASPPTRRKSSSGGWRRTLGAVGFVVLILATGTARAEGAPGSGGPLQILGVGPHDGRTQQVLLRVPGADRLPRDAVALTADGRRRATDVDPEPVPVDLAVVPFGNTADEQSRAVSVTTDAVLSLSGRQNLRVISGPEGNLASAPDLVDALKTLSVANGGAASGSLPVTLTSAARSLAPAPGGGRAVVVVSPLGTAPIPGVQDVLAALRTGDGNILPLYVLTDASPAPALTEAARQSGGAVLPLAGAGFSRALDLLSTDFAHWFVATYPDTRAPDQVSATVLVQGRPSVADWSRLTAPPGTPPAGSSPWGLVGGVLLLMGGLLGCIVLVLMRRRRRRFRITREPGRTTPPAVPPPLTPAKAMPAEATRAEVLPAEATRAEALPAEATLSGESSAWTQDEDSPALDHLVRDSSGETPPSLQESAPGQGEIEPPLPAADPTPAILPPPPMPTAVFPVMFPPTDWLESDPAAYTEQPPIASDDGASVPELPPAASEIPFAAVDPSSEVDAGTDGDPPAAGPPDADPPAEVPQQEPRVQQPAEPERATPESGPRLLSPRVEALQDLLESDPAPDRLAEHLLTLLDPWSANVRSRDARFMREIANALALATSRSEPCPGARLRALLGEIDEYWQDKALMPPRAFDAFTDLLTGALMSESADASAAKLTDLATTLLGAWLTAGPSEEEVALRFEALRMIAEYEAVEGEAQVTREAIQAIDRYTLALRRRADECDVRLLRTLRTQRRGWRQRPDPAAISSNGRG